MEPEIRLLRSPTHAAAFRALNEAWIEEHFTLEDEDRRQLADPVATYVDPGGAILIAEVDGEAVGCVALERADATRYELSKMAVAPALRGRGLGRRLLTAAIDHARGLGARTLFLGSNAVLADAVHLYESVGFVHVDPATLHMPYARANVFMRLDL